MIRFVVDASVALKWVVDEVGSAEATQLRQAERLFAPDLIFAECANALWKKARRGEMEREVALAAARLLVHAQIEIRSARALMEQAAELALALDHPAYDGFYLALAVVKDCPLVTADARLTQAVARSAAAGLPETLTLTQAGERLKT